MPGKGALSSFSFCLNRWSDSAPAFSLVQQDVRQQRRQRPAPRRPSVVGATRPASMTPASRLSPHQHQHPLVRHLARQPLHQHVVVHPVEELDLSLLALSSNAAASYAVPGRRATGWSPAAFRSRFAADTLAFTVPPAAPPGESPRRAYKKRPSGPNSVRRLKVIRLSATVFGRAVCYRAEKDMCASSAHWLPSCTNCLLCSAVKAVSTSRAPKLSISSKAAL